jgi:antibiotic biosynthesis monooxygenase (ABM) superfamily enzyme
MWKNEQDRQILAEVYRSFATAFDGNNNPTAYQSWFRGAGIVENHPMKMARTLVINCNYRPLLLMKEIL